MGLPRKRQPGGKALRLVKAGRFPDSEGGRCVLQCRGVRREASEGAPTSTRPSLGTLLSLSDQRLPQEMSRVLPKPDKHALTLLT